MIDRRSVLTAAASLASIGLARTAPVMATPKAVTPSGNSHDLIIVGAGTAGLPAAIFASRRGARVLVLDAAPVVGGTLFYSTGQMSAANTRLQRERGIDDSADAHFDDVMRISRNTANPELVRLAVDQAGPMLDWLMDSGFEPMPDHPVMGLGHEFYSKRRYYWGKNGGRSILEVLTRELEAARGTGRIDVVLNCRVTSLLQSDAGRVEGVRATQAGEELVYRSGQVLLSCGGYASNPALWAQLDGYRQHVNAAYPYSQGDGLLLAREAGAYLRGQAMYLTSFGAMLADESSPAALFANFETWPDRRPPWEIYVNARGARFMREDQTSVHERELALLPQPEQRFWIVFDEHMLANSPPGVKSWSRDEIRAAAARQSVVYTAANLDELARRAGIDAAGLSHSVTRYNAAVIDRRDLWGRTHLPAPISIPPFYAIRMQGFSITSNVGISVDARLRVIDIRGEPIPGLHAVGEAIGHSQMSGKAYVGGMSVTPALSLGRWLGQTMPLPMSSQLSLASRPPR